MSSHFSPPVQDRRDPLTEQEAEDCVTPLSEAGDTVHDYLVGTAALIAKGADSVYALHALDALTTAQGMIRNAERHLINAMAHERARFTDPLEAAAAIKPEQGDSLR